MNTIKLLQLGDIHYDQARLERAVDLKDRTMPAKLLESATVSPLQAVFRKLAHTEVDGIAMVGDLTTGGDLEIYEACAKYLTDSLDLRKWDSRLVHVVPGNHDVDPELTGQDDLLAKFVPLEETWTKLGLPVLSANGPRQGTVQQEKSGVEIFGLNSAVGTGEHEAEKAKIPAAFAEAMQEARLQATAGADHFGVNVELFDTPSFIESHIAHTCEQIEKLPIETIPVLVSHHNLMPQALPRVAPYAHVLNGGMARDRLTACGRPVVYLHGHIHERPIEVVRQYAPKQGELICISAPLVMRGFNLLELTFTAEGLPLGCVVRQFGVSSNGNVEEVHVAQIPFVTGPRAAGPLVKHIVSALAEKSPYRFEDLREHLRGAGHCPGGEEELGDALREAEWHGLVSIGERNYPPIHWRISGELP
jgi:Calcineurin-like phosphoesterase